MTLAPGEGYCVKCKGGVMMEDVHEITFKNGRKADQGVCPECKTKVTRIK